MEGEIIRHPAFGQIRVTRPHGGKIRVFGSDVDHHSCVHVEINTATLRRDLSRDWIHEDKRIIEFWMSEAQWAHFVSSFGEGAGTPVTLRWARDQGEIEPPPPPPTILEKFDNDIKERTARATERLKSTGKLLRELREQKKPPTKAQLDVALEAVAMSLQDIVCNLPFVETSFREKMEQTVTDAMIDFDAYKRNALERLGMESLAGTTPELNLLPQPAENTRQDTMYEPYPNPPVGVTVWHKTREEFGTVTSTGDPSSVILQFADGEQEVSRHLLERSIFRKDNVVNGKYYDEQGKVAASY